jgi:hypothetical protein
MNFPDTEILPDDLLFHIEHRIARRADELARSTHSLFSSCDHWREAEREIWDHEEFVTRGRSEPHNADLSIPR